MKFIGIFTALIFAAGMSAKAQSAEDSVKMVINNLFAAMKQGDGRSLQNCFADSALLQTVSRNKAGETIVRNEPVSDFVAFISRETKGNADERITFETIKIDGNLAMAWTPYQFYYKGQFSHCGVNSFQLVRMNNGWRVQYIIDTRRKAGCN
ncbi:nuclear transport factor 2 family protein [Ferruginibacter sp. HRS2-29]|uniref:nuclear transport factor 2 family protein n=1 Tax=Ferruginibacter sp. HRS2-29 TaxID=2487334 RepID=UPI0020CC04EE|nr:nuclear transport factor 2 family protein [Ferruginibacter sp. HRS2-29]MCP9750641.1 hypothetical protein [Ferruginibacter sp. HRS2-29]